MKYDTYTNSSNTISKPNIHTSMGFDGDQRWYADYNGLRYECVINNKEVVHITTRSLTPDYTILKENESGIICSSKWGIPKNVLGKIYRTWEKVENRE